jgi:hypothetical protein
VAAPLTPAVTTALALIDTCGCWKRRFGGFLFGATTRIAGHAGLERAPSDYCAPAHYCSSLF